MKIYELRENEPLEMIEVSRHEKIPTFPWDKTITPRTSEFKLIEMIIFTDGEIEKESDEIARSIEEYYIGKRKYQYDVDTLKTKNIYIKKHSYVITYLIAKEWTTVGNVGGWFDVIKDVSVYLENSKDRKALKTAKQVIRQIAEYNNRADYSSIYAMLFSQENELEKIETDKVSQNVYTVSKIK